MKTIDRLLMKARKIQNTVMMFFPIIVPDKEAADRVSAELDEYCGEKPYSAIILYGEAELSDDAEGVQVVLNDLGR